ncbi:hypothetical protein acsn021_34910 [Anaerocolumna cellulosilytica]|uniref:Uncharacterized protein n=1 Tax=Anaerocolumna cellulosilytica TaxID=433286 RepID=A0A6S6R9H5_9FIRM|nr:phosphatase [Anaerocolumna cellulosilytica]MBB5195390.1 exopolyphosphatase/guanosine-5'-triphosphate,3'-diphosphate pyrophosphatase [Anaerocolumna cellulosilytica]BCJ95922.1 hypothetical protein acsn021_34910 [Anaerocolumna cellulosilytica]
MISAIVDLGSNTIRLCIYEHTGNEVKSLFQKKTMAGLANHVKNQQLSKNGIKKTCEILNEYTGLLNNFQVEQKDVYVFATASLRNIVNTKEVISIIKQSTGYDVELLSGEEEATLDFKGATRVITSDSGILVDIGGGSTELVAFKNREIIYATSMPIGSLNLYIKHVKKIIPKKEEREEIRKTVLENMEALELKQDVYATICGVGGTMRAAVKLSNHMFEGEKGSQTFQVSHVQKMLDSINNSHRSTLTPVLQNIPDRIHTIIPGLIVLDTIADYFNSKSVVVSSYGIREGYLYERIIKGE